MLKCLMVNGLWTPWKCEEDRRPDRVLTPCVGVMEGIIKVASSKHGLSRKITEHWLDGLGSYTFHKSLCIVHTMEQWLKMKLGLKRIFNCMQCWTNQDLVTPINANMDGKHLELCPARENFGILFCQTQAPSEVLICCYKNQENPG